MKKMHCQTPLQSRVCCQSLHSVFMLLDFETHRQIQEIIDNFLHSPLFSISIHV